MRFLTEGPSTPDDLSKQRHQGNLVFFCGADVSLSPGVTSFTDVCRHVIDELHVPSDGESRVMLERHIRSQDSSVQLPPLNHIFEALQHEYPPEDIDYQITRRLKPRGNASLSAHETVLRLSKSAAGTPQIVTTNFDFLFEKAAKYKLKRFCTQLGTLLYGQQFSGRLRTHNHGCLR